MITQRIAREFFLRFIFILLWGGFEGDVTRYGVSGECESLDKPPP